MSLSKETQSNIQVFQKASERDLIKVLTPKQQEALKLRGFYDGELRPFRKITQQELDDQGDISFQALSDRAVRALRRLKKLMPDEDNNSILPRDRHEVKMTEAERSFMLQNPDLPAIRIAQRLRHSKDVIGRWKDELGLPRMSRGRPRKQR